MNGNSAYFYTSWDFHPTTEGHAYMADVIGVQTIATSESLTTAEATTQTSILQTTKDIKTHISTVQTTEIPSTSETIQTEVSTQTDNTASTNILTAEPQIPTEPVPPNVGNIKTPIFICIALVALISICSGIIIKRNR